MPLLMQGHHPTAPSAPHGQPSGVNPRAHKHKIVSDDGGPHPRPFGAAARPNSSKRSNTQPSYSHTHQAQPNPPSAHRGRPPSSGTQQKPQPPQQKQQAPQALSGAKAPLSCAKALTVFGDLLSDYEKQEMVEYTHIYYPGCKQKVRAPTKNGVNFGYDDDRGDYRLILNDHILYRYEVLSLLGKGSFGQVVKCLDHRTGQHIALKIIRNKRKFHKQAMIEIKLLQHLRANDRDQNYNVVQMHDYFLFRNHICMVFDLHSVNIYEFLKMNKFQPLNLNLVRKFAVQLLRSLAYLFREKIIHCDLKPENILLKQANRAGIKLIDFGSSCFEHERLYTYMQSRFYRAPEVILAIPYGRPIDMWSFGCTVVEMATGLPLFPGENETEQLACIMEIMGVPPAKLIQRSPRKKQFFDSNGAPKLVANSKGKRRRPGDKRLSDCCRTTDPVFLDFIRGCLHWLPEQRFTPDQALSHPWITEQAPPAHPPAPAHPHPPMQPAPPSGAAPPAHRIRNPESYLPQIARDAKGGA
eukprot:TRINITY_DN4996_c0_g2_i1.p1 TRINITY_DN4996_c0_g2~~TRINITY_DN4996_c0_g2_i1.p1  ORF type:complete len:525 (+),score=138.28 TRINITY_DN4996_c0_g2_i1:212-1786(+)